MGFLSCVRCLLTSAGRFSLGASMSAKYTFDIFWAPCMVRMVILTDLFTYKLLLLLCEARWWLLTHQREKCHPCIVAIDNNSSCPHKPICGLGSKSSEYQNPSKKTTVSHPQKGKHQLGPTARSCCQTATQSSHPLLQRTPREPEPVSIFGFNLPERRFPWAATYIDSHHQQPAMNIVCRFIGCIKPTKRRPFQIAGG